MLFDPFLFASQVFLLHLLHWQFNVIDVSFHFNIRYRCKRQYLESVFYAHWSVSTQIAQKKKHKFRKLRISFSRHYVLFRHSDEDDM